MYYVRVARILPECTVRVARILPECTMLELLGFYLSVLC